MTGIYGSEISSILAPPRQPDEKVMLDRFSRINSLISDDEALALFRLCMLPPPQTDILEIGSYTGGSTAALGHAAIARDLHIFCIDKWSDYREQSDFFNMDRNLLDDMRIMGEFIGNTSFLKDRISMLRGDASDFSRILGSSLFSLVFIDGAHDYRSVMNDIIFGLRVIEPGGILCGHDYHSAGIDVKKAVHDLIIQSETIAVKGLINNTSIWYSVIEDPAYELLVATAVRCIATGDLRGAYAMVTEGSEGFRETAEILRIRKGLEQEMGLRHSANV